MTKSDISDYLYEKVGGFSKKESADFVDSVFDFMKDTLSQKEHIKISGFGSFSVREKKSRMGRNPQTGDPIVICERSVVNFKASQVLRTLLNKKRH